MEILVIVPQEIAHDAVSDPAVKVRGYRTFQDVLAALGAPADAVVLLSDLVPETNRMIIAGAVKQGGRPVIEVRSERWDGESDSPLSAACRGVISGFGLAGIEAAVALLRRERAAG
ncbi:MAG: hypothetical protein ACKVVT_13330 [Dehalococcoidia bacterium]